MRTRHLASMGLILAVAQPAPAATTQWGVQALTAYADCSLLVCSTLIDLTFADIVTHTQSGGLNQASAAELNVAQVHDTFMAGPVDMGVVSAQVDLDPTNLSVPVLKAEAITSGTNNLDGWISGMAFAIQGYQYTGGSATTINLSANLTGSIQNPGVHGSTALSVGIWLASVDPNVMFPNPPPSTVGELALFAAQLPVVDFWIAEASATGAVSLGTGGDPVSITVNPGEEFYLIAALAAGATDNDQFADAFSTLTMNFDNQNLAPSGVVPLPAALWLIAPALLAVARRRMT